MTYLALGLLLFLGVHSVRIFADDWRQKRLDTLGEAAWKGTYSLVSIAGFALIVWGYGVARQTPVVLWVPPVGLRHAASLLTLASFVLLAATYVPGNALKAKLKHPMVLGIKLWALAHLLSNGNLADVLLFGSFLLWAILSFRAARLRDAAAVVKAEITHSPASRTIATLVGGVVAWSVFALWAHGPLIGVRPFGG